MPKIFFILFLSLMTCLGSLASDQSSTAAQPLTGEARFIPQTAQAGEIIKLFFELQLEQGYKAYVDEFKVKVTEPEDVKAGQLEISNQFTFFDKFSKRERTAIQDETSIKALIETPLDLPAGDYEFVVALTYQACTEKFCLFPKSINFKVPLEILSGSDQPTSTVSSSEPPGTSYSGFSFLSLQLDFEESLFLSFFLVFLAGILTSFTPCIFPMIPITVAILGRGSSERTRLRNFSLSLVYVLGIALTYASLGVLAASTGAMFGATLNHPLILALISGVFIAMAISMFGGFEIQAPAFIRNRLGQADTGQGLKGAFLMGLLAGVVASPCVGPILVGILTYVAQTQDLLLGFALLFVFALGLGQLFLLLGLSGEIGRFLPRSGTWMEAIKFFFGSIMLGVAFYYLKFLIPTLYWWSALGLALIAVSSLYGAFLQGPQLQNGQLLRKGIMLAVFIVGVGLAASPLLQFLPIPANIAVIGASDAEDTEDHWVEYSEEAFQHAIANNQPILIDFYADWCVACKELEMFTFSEESFKAASADMLLLRFDATNPSPQLEDLTKKYGIVGLPTVLFFDSEGRWRKELTLTGFEDAPGLIKRLRLLEGPSAQ